MNKTYSVDNTIQYIPLNSDINFKLILQIEPTQTIHFKITTNPTDTEDNWNILNEPIEVTIHAFLNEPKKYYLACYTSIPTEIHCKFQYTKWPNNIPSQDQYKYNPTNTIPTTISMEKTSIQDVLYKNPNHTTMDKLMESSSSTSTKISTNKSMILTYLKYIMIIFFVIIIIYILTNKHTSSSIPIYI